MRTRRYKLYLYGINVQFYLLVFENTSKIDEYVRRKSGDTLEDGVGFGACLANSARREILICLPASRMSHTTIGHEAFHAALYYAKMNRRRFTKNKWVRLLESWDYDENAELEEELAQVLGALLDEIWYVFSKKFDQKTTAAADSEDV